MTDLFPAPRQDLTSLVDVSRHRQNRRLIVVSVVLFLAPMIGAFGVLAYRQPDLGIRPAVVFYVLMVAALGPLLGVGMVLWARKLGASWVQPAPVMGLDRAPRRAVLRALRRGQPIPVGYEDVAAAMTAQARRTWWTPLLCWGACLLQVVNVGRDGWYGKFALGIVVVGLAGAAWSFRVHRRTASRTDC